MATWKNLPPPLTFFEIPFYLLKSWRGQMTSNLSKLHTGIGDETRNLCYMFLFFQLYTLIAECNIRTFFPFSISATFHLQKWKRRNKQIQLMTMNMEIFSNEEKV